MEALSLTMQIFSKSRRGGVMCPALVQPALEVCAKDETHYRLTEFQIREYCTTPRHKWCRLRFAGHMLPFDGTVADKE